MLRDEFFLESLLQKKNGSKLQENLFAGISIESEYHLDVDTQRMCA